MAKLTDLFARPRGRIVRRITIGLVAMLAFVLLQFGATQWAQAQQVGADFDHASTGYVLNAQHQDVRCETCHLKGVFKGTPKDCASCHGWNNPRATQSVMSTNHIPTNNAICESCHEANVAQFLDANRTFNHAAVRPLTCVNCHSSNNPHPDVRTNPVDATHYAVLAKGQACDKCHTTVQFTGPKVPLNHIPTAAVACESCHTDVEYALMPTITNIHAYAPSTSSNCAQCHSAANAATYSRANMQIKSPASVANHIPMGAGQDCSTCHVGVGSSIATTPVTTGSTFSGSLFDHSGASASCTTCHDSSVSTTRWYGVAPRTNGSLTPVHVPTTANCSDCHTAGAPTGQVPALGMTTFANAKYLHSTSNTGCVVCHGPSITSNSFYGISSITVMPSTTGTTATADHLPHLPSSTTCETCHAQNKPQGPIPMSLGGSISLFQQPNVPSSVQIHNDSAGSCMSCHEAGSNWTGMGLLSPTRTTNVNSLNFYGFQTRPQGTSTPNGIVDSGHVAGTKGSGDCFLCHGNTLVFGTPSKPAGHIPYNSSASCGDCHADFTTAPAVGLIHQNIQSTTSNCQQCHSTANAALYAATTTLKPIVTPPANHIAMGGLDCSTCHVGGAGSGIASTPISSDGVHFTGSYFSHGVITTGCGDCHGPNVAAGSFYGVTPKTAVGLPGGGHMPVSNNVSCEICHTNSIPTALVPPTGYSGTPSFAGGQFIHTYVTSGCANCHANGLSFFNVSSLVLMPATTGTNAHIPTAAACENCHSGSIPSGLLSVTTAHAMPGSGFRNSPPNTSTIHSNVTGACTTCHESTVPAWVGMDVQLYARNQTSVQLDPNYLYTGFNTRPISGAASGYSMRDDSHPAGECSTCHGNTDAFGQPVPSSSHIPYKTGALCSACHVSWTTLPTFSAIHANRPTTGTCQDCHSGPQANADKYSAKATRPIVQPLSTHVPMQGQDCATCHIGVNASMATVADIDVGKFHGSGFSHNTSLKTGCAACHGPTVTGFQGITASQIIVMPQTSPVGTSSHIPSSTTCETCHVQNMPSSQVAGNAAHAAPGSGFQSPAATTDKVHSGMTNGCAACHEKDMDWMSMSANADAHTTSAPYKGFQTRPYGTPTSQWAINDSAHTTSGECSNCHSGFTEWSAQAKPNIHIPTDAACINCHTTSNYATKPLNANIHANMPSTAKCADCHSTSNAAHYSTVTVTIVGAADPAGAQGHIPMAALDCKDCHVGANTSMTTVAGMSESQHFTNSAFSHTGVAATSCANCHAGGLTSTTFQGTIPNLRTFTTPALALPHVPNPASLDCGVCHTSIPSGQVKSGGGGTTFAGGKFSHSGITTGCNDCHGTGKSSAFQSTTIVVLPATASGTTGHIPSPIVTTCETCHLGSTPSGLIAAVATVTTPGSTKFRLNGTTPPDGTMIHTGVNGVCNVCHESGLTWVDTSLYPRNYTTKQTGATATLYTGFNTRPDGVGALNSILDTSHPGGTAECATCHGSTTSFSAAALPSNHIPFKTGAQCQNCHTNLTSNGTGGYVSSSVNFSVPPTLLNIHTYAPTTNTNCQLCHSTSNAATLSIPAQGAVAAYPIKSPGPLWVANHIPFSTTACETCHVLTTPVSGGTFAGGKFSHANFSTGCATCHQGTPAYTNVTLKAIPVSTNINGSTTHIPYGTTTCESCHLATVPSGLVSVTGPVGTGFATPMAANADIHTNSTSFTCKTCHDRGYQWLGVGGYTRAPAAVNTTVSTTQYTGFQTRPGTTGVAPYGYTDANHTGSTLDTGDCSLCHVGTSYFTGEGKPSGHIPTTASCATCHTSTTGDYSVAGLAAAATLHPGLTAGAVTYTAANFATTTTCESCHGGTMFAGCTTQATCAAPPPITYQPKLMTAVAKHVPVAPTASPTKTLDCNACHISLSLFSGATLGTTGHANELVAGMSCMQCHESGLSWTNVTRITLRPSGHHTGTDCGNSGCHTYSRGFRGVAKPKMRSALVSPDMGRIKPTTQNGKPSRGSLGNTYDHKGVEAGKCKTCHDGKSASGMPARHLMVATSCDTCHRPTSWLPAQFDHKGITPNTCLACHNGMGASNKPSGHFMTSRSCDSCHKNMSWTPVNYQHISPLYRASPDKLTCVSCHDTNGEIVRRQARALTRTKPLPVGP